jgi:hypothetical protein
MVEHQGTPQPGRDHANRDPLTHSPGAHPIGTGVGAAAGGLAGAAAGAVGGPIGMMAGAVLGAVGGGLAGKAGGEAINPTDEDRYWRDEYRRRPYVDQGAPYEAYEPAYRFGWEAYGRYSTRFSSFDDADRELEREWAQQRGGDWERQRAAAKDAWERLAWNARRPGERDNCG